MSITATPPAATVSAAEHLDALLARPVVTIDESTELVPVSKSTIVRAITAGELPRRKVGRRVLIPTAALLAWAGVEIDVKKAS